MFTDAIITVVLSLYNLALTSFISLTVQESILNVEVTTIFANASDLA